MLRILLSIRLSLHGVRSSAESTRQDNRKILIEVAKFMSESGGEVSEQRPSTSTPSSTTMANFQIPPPDILELNDGSTASNWRIWVSAWKNYMLATKLDKENEERQVATLLAVNGKEANKVFVHSHGPHQATPRKLRRS